MTSPLLKALALFEGPVDLLLSLIGVHEFLPSTEFLANVGGSLCSDTSITQFLCTNSLFVLCGFNINQMNTELLPVIMGHTPAGSSVGQFVHYAQSIKTGKFRQYDYGLVKNLFVYKSIHPPKYDLSKVTAPVALFYSRNDWLSAQVDVLKLYGELSNPIGRFVVTDGLFNHLDYMWGKDADTIVYNKIFALMNKY
ncbi:Lipase 4 [Carabus blaptoides fortunei]